MNPSKSIMNDQHRATPEQWQAIKANGHLPTRSTILELLHRVQALESAQQAHADASHVIDPEKEKMAQEFCQAVAFAPRWSDFDRFFAGIQAPQSATTAQPNHPEIPGSSLKERIRSRMIESAGSTWDVIAASVLVEVADWLNTKKRFDVAIELRVEAER